MGRSNLAITLILAFTALAPLSLPQTVNSQSLTTMSTVQQLTSTHVTTATSVTTSTGVTLQTVRYDLTPSDFNNLTGTFTLGYSEIGTQPYYPNSLCLMYDYFLLNTTTAYEFKIHFATQQMLPIHFLIMTINQLNQFTHTNCATGTFTWELNTVAPTSDLVWVVPQPGEYALLFYSRQFLGGYVQLNVQAYGQIIRTSTTAFTTSNLLQLLSTQIFTSTLQIIAPTSAASNESTLIIGAATIALVIVATAIILRSRRHPRSLSPK